MKIFFIYFFILSFYSVQINKNKEIDFGVFKMTVPNNWKYIKGKGIDSFVGRFIIAKKDTVTFDYGIYSNNLEEVLDFEITGDSIFSIKSENNNFIKREFYAKRDSVIIENLYKSETSFVFIGNLNAKIVKPKKSGIGLIGVYFENTTSKKNGVKFQISGYNLSPKNQKSFLKVIKTLKFKH